MPIKLPKFKYHPYPIKTGSIKKSNNTCRCCGEIKGYIYVGPIFTNFHLSQSICPWCIADGSAHEKFGAEFTDFHEIGGKDQDEIPLDSIEEIAYRTPGFLGWQQGRWMTHCGEGAEFLGRVGKKEAKNLGSDFLNSIHSDTGITDEDEWKSYLDSLNKETSPTAYAFRCRECGKILGYQDSH